MVILGIHDGHNSTASLLIDGKIAALINEERYTYRKNEMGFPENAIRECLRIAGLQVKDIDHVAFTTQSYPLHYMKAKREFAFTIKDWLEEQEEWWKPKLFENRINTAYLDRLAAEPRFNEAQAYKFNGTPAILPEPETIRLFAKLRRDTMREFFGIVPEKIHIYDHHTSHAYYAYFGSPFRGKKTLVLTSDGGGDGANGTLSIAEGDVIREIARNNVSDLGRLYRYITLMLGMKINEHEYKVMGLAPYASDYEIERCGAVFDEVFHVPDLLIEYKRRPKDLFFHFRESLAHCRFDGIAGALQRMVEQVGAEWFRKTTTELGISRVVFSGGLSMNVKLNQVACRLDSVKEFYCPASGGDESCSLGAAYIAHSKFAKTPVSSIENNYLGPSYGREEVLKLLPRLKKYKVREGVTAREVAKLLADNVVVGRFAGRMEFGARSLGNRSILANPSNPDVVGKINRQIKFRDFWMPFAPTVLDKHAEEYLSNPKGMLSDHMTLCFDTTPEGRKALVAATHPADHTVRAQILRKENNPGYYELIEEFRALTGIGGLLNTSFNLHGYPIVCKPEHALHVFENSKLDAMILEDVLVQR